MLLSKLKVIIAVVLLSGIMARGAATASMSRSNNTYKASTASLANDSEVLVTKEINCPKIGLNLLMDVPKSWEGKYYVKEDSYLYELGTDTVNNGGKFEEKSIKIIFKDPETKYEFPLITIVSRNNVPLDQIFLDNTIIKNFNGEEYAIGGPTGGFDEPKSALVKYMVMHDESIAVMKSLRIK